MSLFPRSPLLLLLLSLLSATSSSSAETVVLSPDSHLSFHLDLDATGNLIYSINQDETPIVLPSRLGITVDKDDLGHAAKIGQPGTPKEIQNSYPLWGVHSTAMDHDRDVLIPMQGGDHGTKWTLEVRAFNDGIAYRYHVPGDGARHVDGESSSWNFPTDNKIWYQNDLSSYEGLYTPTTIGALKSGTVLCFPSTLARPNNAGYVLITEANLVNFSDMTVKADDHGALNAFFYANTSGWPATGAITSPWRVTMVVPNLNALVNCDIVHDLCPAPPAQLAHTDWIKPGRCAWQWWSSETPKLEEQHQWVDWAKQLGFEYYLIDEGWERWPSKDGKDCWSDLAGVVDYGNSQGVKVWIWVNSSEVFSAKDRAAYFAKAKAAGVYGIKIDFPPQASLDVVNWYEDTLRDAAALHFMIDFHGTIKPTGRDRTWPNEVNREGIRGHEYQLARYGRELPPEHDTILPFTRYVAGHADYTPTAFNPDELKGYTWPRELAQAVVFTAPFLCYADSPKRYLENPAVDVLKAIPSTWDETIVLPGSEIGQVVAFARRKGNSWFIGVINGAAESKLHLPLTFLGTKTYHLLKIEDDPNQAAALKRTDMDVTSADSLDLDLRARGGFVGWLTDKSASATATGSSGESTASR